MGELKCCAVGCDSEYNNDGVQDESAPAEGSAGVRGDHNPAAAADVAAGVRSALDVLDHAAADRQHPLLPRGVLAVGAGTAPPTQLYIFFNIFILFILGYNEIYYFYVKVKMEEDSPFVETFKNNYVEWGYAIEGVFRLVGIVIAWRAYQFSEMLENYGDGEDHLADALEANHNDLL